MDGRARTPCAPRRAEDCPPYLFPRRYWRITSLRRECRCYRTALATIVVVAKNRRPMLSTITPKPSRVLTLISASRLIPRTPLHQSFQNPRRSQWRSRSPRVDQLFRGGGKTAFAPPRDTWMPDNRSLGSQVNSEPVSTSTSTGAPAIKLFVFWDCGRRH